MSGWVRGRRVAEGKILQVSSSEIKREESAGD